MAQDTQDAPPAQDAAALPQRPGFAARWTRRIVTTLLLLAAGLGLLFLILDSAIGHRFVIDRIAQVTPGSGLRVKIGRIDGSLFGASTLRDVVISDPHGRFMTVPEVDLDWRPLSWLHSGLDIRTCRYPPGPRIRTRTRRNVMRC